MALSHEEVLERIERSAQLRWPGLDLSHSAISDLPGEIERYTSLERLQLNNNQLTALPEEIGRCANLETLWLHVNQLASLPNSIGQLANLKYLYLSDNRLPSLPDSMGNLVRLQRLDLSYNHLTVLPDSIGQLANLQELNLRNNLLTALPESVRHLGNLEILNLTRNNLTTLPASLGYLTRLKELYLEGNLLPPALWEAHKASLDDLRYYLLGLADEEAPKGTEGSGVPAIEPDNRRVFVIYGHDHGRKETLARFLEQLGLEAIILHEQASRGDTIIEKLERHGDPAFAVALLTPDDMGYTGTDAAQARPRARQNVVLELGYFLGRLGRERTCAMVVGDVEFPSDIRGVGYVRMDEAGAWKLALARELQATGLAVDLNLEM